MLEQRIEELTAAVKELTFALAKSGNFDVPNMNKWRGTNDEPQIAASKPLKEETPAKVEPIAEEAPNVSPTSEPSELESAPVSYDDVKKATNALSAAKGRDVTIATLAMFNVQKATQLVEAQWAEYVAYATKVASDA